MQQQQPSPPPPTPPPAINFATEWLDEDGCVCPKNVDYATQCPKGHVLVPVADSGEAQAHRLICRVCHRFDEPGQSQWHACKVANCCGGYAICRSCVNALSILPVAGNADDNFPSQVQYLRAASAGVALHLPRLVCHFSFSTSHISAFCRALPLYICVG
jgi:hypothetical protein